MNLAEEQDVSNLFMARYNANKITCSIWLVDSGCSNHMTGIRKLF